MAVDQAVPFNVFGGLQDNGAWKGPSDGWQAGGIQDRDWTFVGLDDGSATLPVTGRVVAGGPCSVPAVTPLIPTVSVLPHSGPTTVGGTTSNW